MDKDLFRLILLGLGVALVLVVYYWDRLRGLFARRPAASSRRPRATPRIEDPFGEPDEVTDVAARPDAVDEELPDVLASELEALIRNEEPTDVLLEEPAPRETAQAGAAREERAAPTPPPVLALTLVSSSGSISGIRLRRVLTDHGLGLGKRGLFERIGEEGRPLYSAANLVEPGVFDPITLDGLSTPGLVLFQVLEGPGDHLETFEAMLGTARRLAERLDCALCDTRRKPLADAEIDALRGQAAGAVAG